MPDWFPPGWEARYRRERHTVVALRNAEMLGYADFHPGPERGSFGPTAVRPDERGRGIGSCLLAEAMRRMKELGTPRAWAYWANTPFYLKNGWRICRTYVAFRRPL
jgi:GNAT superfamily N-acetyltransferase